MCHKHIMEYYSTLKKKEILPHATTWMNLEDTMLSEINQKKREGGDPDYQSRIHNPKHQMWQWGIFFNVKVHNEDVTLMDILMYKITQVTTFIKQKL